MSLLKFVAWVLLLGGFPLFISGGDDEPELFKMSLEELMALDVTTASKGKGSISDSPAIISVITSEEIENLGARTLGELLNLIPGFEVNRAVMFGVHETVGVRGRMTDFGEDVLILLDGQRLNEVYTGGGMHQIKIMRTENIERVEMIRGPGSTLYGSNAFVGIVNILTKSNVNAGEKVGVAVNGGSFGALGGELHAGLKRDRGFIKVFASFGRDDGDSYQLNKGFLRPPVSLPAIEDPVQEMMDLNLRAGWGSFKLNVDHFVRKLDGFMPWGFLDQAWESEVLSTNQDDSELTCFKLSYEGKINDQLTITPSFRYVEGGIRDLYFIAAPGVPPFSAGTSIDTYGWIGSPNHDTRNAELEVQFNYSLNKHDLVGGLLYAEESLTGAWNRFNFFPFPTELEQIDYGSEPHWFDGAESYVDLIDREVKAIYLQDTWKVHDKVGLTLGIRHDSYSDFGGSTNPRLGLVYRPNDSFFMKALYGTAFRAPTFNELYVRNNPVQRGNSELEAQSIETSELNFNYIVNQDLYLSLSLYENRYKDLIHLVDAAPLPTFANAQEGERDRGAELEVKYKKDQFKYVFFNLSYIDPEATGGGKRAYIAATRASVVANYDFKSKVILNLSAFYRADRHNPTPDPDYDIDDYWVVNANLSFRFLNDLDLRLGVANLGDEQWKSPGFSYVLTPENVPNRGAQVYTRIAYRF